MRKKKNNIVHWLLLLVVDVYYKILYHLQYDRTIFSIVLDEYNLPIVHYPFFVDNFGTNFGTIIK